MGFENIISVALILIVAIVGAYFLFAPGTGESGIPSYVSGEVRETYEWAKTPIGTSLLEQVPCYCGCKYDGHKHARHCFWRDDGSFDKHGITCSVCLDIAKRTKEMYESGRNICEIRDSIDVFYAPNVHLATDTPYPQSCGGA